LKGSCVGVLVIMQRKGRVVVTTGIEEVTVEEPHREDITCSGGFGGAGVSLLGRAAPAGSESDEETHPPRVTVASPKLASSSSHPSSDIQDDIDETLAELAKRGHRPVVGSRRLPVWGPAQSGPTSNPGLISSDLITRLQRSGDATRVPVQQPLFDNAGDDVIKFSRDDNSDSDTSSDQSGVSERSLKRRRREKIDRDFDDAMNSHSASEESQIDSDGESSDTAWEGSQDASDTSSSTESNDDSESSSGDRSKVVPSSDHRVTRGFGAGRIAATTPAPTPLGPSTRAHYAGLTFETLYNAVGGFHQVLLGITKPLTVQGPCKIFGIFGEVSCGGFLIGKKCIHIESKRRVVLQPIQKLTTSTSKMTVEEFRDVAARGRNCPPEIAFPWQPSESQETRMQYLSTASGEHLIDWEWTSATLQNWLARLSSDRSGTSVIMVLQPHVVGERPMRRVNFKAKGENHVDRFGGEDFMHIPRCVSGYHLHPDIEPALLPVFRRVISGSFSVAVVGGQNIGKSTLGRAFANAWFSQLGSCYWVDFDAGRPEFGMSGTLSICQIVRPIRGPNDFGAAKLVKVVHIGGSRIHCPQTAAWAISQLCDFINDHHRSWLRPLVINTHGWIESTGRRTTVEALRRLNPQHVVQFLRHGDPRWVIPEIIYDPKCGLNKRVCSERFLNGLPMELPEASGARNFHVTEVAAPPLGGNTMLVHSLPVVRLDVKHKVAMSRRDNWRWYFQSITGLRREKDATTREGCSVDTIVPQKSSTRLSIDLRSNHVMLAHPQARESSVTVQDFVDAVLGCVIAVGVVSPTTEIQTSHAHVNHPADFASVSKSDRPNIIKEPPFRVCGYAFVERFVAETNSLVLRIGAQPAEVRETLLGSCKNETESDSIEQGNRMVLVACPFDWFDTSS